MSLHVIEGTWEEIKRHEAELIGRHLRVTISPAKSARLSPVAMPKKSSTFANPKKLQARGMLAGILNTEDYLREKREDMVREDRFLNE